MSKKVNLVRNFNNLHSLLGFKFFHDEIVEYAENFSLWQITFGRHYQPVLPTLKKQILKNHPLEIPYMYIFLYIQILWTLAYPETLIFRQI